MIAEERAEWIKKKLKETWPPFNGCTSLECLIEDPMDFYDDFKISPIFVKIGFFKRIWLKIRSLFRGKSN